MYSVRNGASSLAILSSADHIDGVAGIPVIDHVAESAWSCGDKDRSLAFFQSCRRWPCFPTQAGSHCAKRPCEAESAAVTNGSLTRSSFRSGLQHVAECLDYLRIHRGYVAPFQKHLPRDGRRLRGFQNFRLVGVYVASVPPDGRCLRVRDGHHLRITSSKLSIVFGFVTGVLAFAMFAEMSHWRCASECRGGPRLILGEGLTLTCTQLLASAWRDR